jgi:hypothetical protein
MKCVLVIFALIVSSCAGPAPKHPAKGKSKLKKVDHKTVSEKKKSTVKTEIVPVTVKPRKLDKNKHKPKPKPGIVQKDTDIKTPVLSKEEQQLELVAGTFVAPLEPDKPFHVHKSIENDLPGFSKGFGKKLQIYPLAMVKTVEISDESGHIYGALMEFDCRKKLKLPKKCNSNVVAPPKSCMDFKEYVKCKGKRPQIMGVYLKRSKKHPKGIITFQKLKSDIFSGSETQMSVSPWFTQKGIFQVSYKKKVMLTEGDKQLGKQIEEGPYVEFFSLTSQKGYILHHRYQESSSYSWQGLELEDEVDVSYIKGKKTKAYYIVFKHKSTKSVVDTGSEDSNTQYFCKREVIVKAISQKGNKWKTYKGKALKKLTKREPALKDVPKDLNKKGTDGCEDVFGD